MPVVSRSVGHTSGGGAVRLLPFSAGGSSRRKDSRCLVWIQPSPWRRTDALLGFLPEIKHFWQKVHSGGSSFLTACRNLISLSRRKWMSREPLSLPICEGSALPHSLSSLVSWRRQKEADRWTGPSPSCQQRTAGGGLGTHAEWCDSRAVRASAGSFPGPAAGSALGLLHQGHAACWRRADGGGCWRVILMLLSQDEDGSDWGSSLTG